MKTKEEGYEKLMAMKRDGLPDEELELHTVLEELNGRLLVKHVKLVKMGERDYPAVHYEIWDNREHFENQIYEQDGKIFCWSYATTDEEEMIQTFRKSKDWLLDK